MTGEEMYVTWTPEDSVWSPWVKPVLFAQMRATSERDQPLGWRGCDVSWAPSPQDRTALVVNLNGADSVIAGMALAARGYFPVPLFNATAAFQEIVDTTGILDALRASAGDRAAIQVPPGAPPAFLLDANRLGIGRLSVPGKFDNRWLVFPQDFPSANFLRSQGIVAVLVAQMGTTVRAYDLGHVLLRWQKAGIQVLFRDISRPDVKAEPVQIRRPWWFRHAVYRTLMLLGLRRNSAGGFGAVIPEPSASGGGGYHGFG